MGHAHLFPGEGEEALQCGKFARGRSVADALFAPVGKVKTQLRRFEPGQGIPVLRPGPVDQAGRGREIGAQGMGLRRRALPR